MTSISYTFSRWNRVKRGLIELKKIKSLLESRIDRDNEIEIQEAQHQLRDTNLKKDKLLDLYLSDSFTKTQLDSRLKPLEDFAQELQDKIDMLSKTNEDIFREMKEVDEIIKVFKEENDKLQEEANNGSIASKYTRKELLKDIEAIVVGTDGSLTLNFKSLAIISQLTHKYRYLMEKVS